MTEINCNIYFNTILKKMKLTMLLIAASYETFGLRLGSKKCL